jgi:Sulfotransferase family
MGDFAANLAISYEVGAARGDYSTLSAMDVNREEFFASFGQTINDLIINHREDLERRRQENPSMSTFRKFVHPASPSAPKRRWADGTPEYSLHIYGLHSLFPQAQFIHVFRDVQAVVRSMINFHRVAGMQLVANEEEAYRYWLRTVRGCLKAEQAFGPTVVYRVRYADIISNPESTIRSLLGFLGEPYAASCLEPLAHRINSSEVPADFKSNDSGTDPNVIRKAMRLCAEVEETPQPRDPSPAAVNELEAAFRERVKCIAPPWVSLGKTPADN